MERGFIITNHGRERFAKLLAGEPLVITRVMVGSGKVENAQEAADLTDLVTPVARGTSTIPSVNGSVVSMIVEYRSDLDGGLDHGFWLNEFGIFAADGDDEVLIYYGTLGDYPAYVSASRNGTVDVRRFPVSVVVVDGVDVQLDYPAGAFMTAEDVRQHCVLVILPQFLDETRRLIAEHNVAPDSHLDIRAEIDGVNSRLGLLELKYGTEIKGNSFTVTFGTLDGLVIEGVWNKSQKRIEF